MSIAAAQSRPRATAVRRRRSPAATAIASTFTVAISPMSRASLLTDAPIRCTLGIASGRNAATTATVPDIRSRRAASQHSSGSGATMSSDNNRMSQICRSNGQCSVPGTSSIPAARTT